MTLKIQKEREKKKKLHDGALQNCSASVTSSQLLTSLRVYRETNGCITPVTFPSASFSLAAHPSAKPPRPTLKVEGPRGSVKLQGHTYQTGDGVSGPLGWAGHAADARSARCRAADLLASRVAARGGRETLEERAQLHFRQKNGIIMMMRTEAN